MTKRPLGRGLSALISTDSPRAEADEIREIEIDLIRPGHQQPRTTFAQAKLDELAQSIRNSGIIQPLLVRPRGGLFELVAGERRWRAAQLAGLPRVPAIIREIPDDKLLELALIENIQRQELNPIEEANAYKRLIESLNLTQEEVAQRVGRDRTFVTNYLRILKLPSEIQLLLENEKLSFGHARALLGLGDVILQRRYAQKIVKHNWSVRETERRIKHAPETKPAASKPMPHQADPNMRAAEAKLRRHLGTQVQIVPARNSSAGKIEIEYYSALDLDRLYTVIISASETDGANAATASSGL
jgi:ParB family transcriptional regulator, chromosome partitioning protein